jgi:PncC family amidohydrolase
MSAYSPLFGHGPETPEGEGGGTDDALTQLRELTAVLQEACLGARLTLATAESCTGGLIGHAITEHSGSSAYYLGGVVSYADRVKTDLLGVPASALQAHGAVSAQVAAAMAEGACRRFGADLGLAVTGIAGPDGGTESKPVGLVYVAVAGAAGAEVRRHQWHGDRGANKVRSAEAAVRLVLERLGVDPDA